MTGHLFLIGMMGAGKTTTGRILAARLGRQFFDSDEQVERKTGRTVPEILEESGEPAFRAEERLALAEAAASQVPAVIAVAGGAVLDPENRRVLRSSGTVVWLRPQVETLAKRVGAGVGRPLLGDDPPEALARLYAERLPLYEEVADLVVDVEGRSPDQVADEVLAGIGAGSGGERP